MSFDLCLTRCLLAPQVLPRGAVHIQLPPGLCGCGGLLWTWCRTLHFSFTWRPSGTMVTWQRFSHPSLHDSFHCLISTLPAPPFQILVYLLHGRYGQNMVFCWLSISRTSHWFLTNILKMSFIKSLNIAERITTRRCKCPCKCLISNS